MSDISNETAGSCFRASRAYGTLPPFYGIAVDRLKRTHLAALFMVAGTSLAQVAPPPPVISSVVAAPAVAVPARMTAADIPGSVNFAEYLVLVRANNLGIAAQKAQIDIADAQIALAALFPDPIFTTGLAAYEMTRDKLPTFSTFGINFTIEGGKKRQVRTEAARADKARAEAEFERQIMAVQLDATNAYIDYLKAREFQSYRQSAITLLQRLTRRVNTVHKKSDSVSEVQLQTEVLRAQAELDAANADVYIASRAMLGFLQLGAQDITRPMQCTGSLGLAVLPESETMQAQQPQVLREDVLVAQRTLDSARKREELSRENRSLDLNFNIGVNHGRQGDYLGTYLPQSNSLMATLAIPIPFSLRQDGDLRAASAATTQAMKQFEDVSLRAALDAEQTKARYRAAVSQMQKYQQGSDLSAKALSSQIDLYMSNQSDLGDVVLLYKLSNESQTFSVDSRASHARSLAAIMNQMHRIHEMKF